MEKIEVLSQSEPAGNTKIRLATNNQCYRWCFTLPVETEPEKLSHVLRDFCKEFYFQIEEGKEDGYLHFQGCISLKVKHRLQEVKNIIGNDKVHLEKTKNWLASIKYCTKEDTRKEGPWDHNSVWIKTIKPEQFYPWQKELLTLIQGEVDDRKVFYFYDLKGGKGKTAFAKYLVVKHNALYLNSGRIQDFAFMFNNQNVVVFNYARDEARINWTAIECIKDGIITSSKYESKTKVFNPPHVIIFSNCEPDLSKLSEDRWVVKCLD